MATQSSSEKHLPLYESFWHDVPDFIRYNPGARHRRRLILRALAHGKFGSLIDVGCGNAELLGTIHRAHPEVAILAGADVAPTQVTRNRDRFPGVDFYTLDIEKASLDRTFDRVVCSEVIEHLDDQATAIRHLASMVSDGGSLVITCPTGKLYATERHFGHVRHPTPDELVHNALAAGLHPMSIVNWGWPAYRLLKWATNVNANWAMRNFGSGQYSPSAKTVSRGLYWLNHLNRSHDARGCQLVAIFQKGPLPNHLAGATLRTEKGDRDEPRLRNGS